MARFQLRDLEYQEMIGNSKFLLHICELRYLILSIDFTLLEGMYFGPLAPQELYFFESYFGQISSVQKDLLPR